MQQRTAILKDIADRLSGYYGPAGTEDKIFRAVRRGPIRPADMRPCGTVSDNGQRRETPDDNVSQDRILAVRFTLSLEDDWTKVADMEKWQDNVEMLIGKFVNWCPGNRGVIRMDYVSDDPFDVVFLSGASEAVWVIDFDCRYFTEANAPENWT